MRANEFNISDPVKELAKKLPNLKKIDYDSIDNLMQGICKRHKLSGQKLHDLFVSKYGHTPDNWVKKIKQRNEQVNEGDVVPFKRDKSQIQYGKRTFPPKQNTVTEPKGNVTPIKKKNTVTGPTLHSIYEDGSEEAQIEKFIAWAKETLHVTGDPKFTFSRDSEQAQKGHHTGVHSGDQIWVYIGNRNMIDILRTVFHELVHQRQDELGMIKNGDSYPGSPIEAMADMLAGKYIKIYGKQHPEIFQ